MKKRIKVNGIIILCAVALIAAFPKIFFRFEKNYWIDAFALVFGIAMVLLGQLLRVSARGYKAEHSDQSKLLVQEGPYVFVRNPMYLGILLIGFGVVLTLFKIWMAGIFLFIFALRYILLIQKEEEKLLAFFPDKYPEYKKKIPSLLPSIAAIFKKEISEYLPLKFIWFKKEIGSITAVLLVTVSIKLWLDIKYKGAKVFLGEAITVAVVIILFVFLVIYLNKKTQKN